ncbi:hypothetical protein SAMN05216601_10870 [Ectopseudomonas composti]|uniref:Uncharacterized protein n=1 Tax=Ectopseudomonas composti TaxID=658457 RepID=A0A1I5P505_9GAMM|nr:hypothetical protein SAMN05216601_10870 [Pseudomonas composti]
MPVKEADLRLYVSAGIVQRTLIQKVADGWTLQVQLKNELHTLQRQRGGNRVFRSLDKLAILVGELGLSGFEVRL